jgi:hypothetical protein
VRDGDSGAGSEPVREWHGDAITVKSQTERRVFEERADCLWKSVVALSKNLPLAHMLSKRHKNATKCCNEQGA